jgi:hypothetical protein
MTRRSIVYDIMSWLLTLSSLFFFYEATQFLTAKDYVASGMTLLIGLLIVRVGVELGKLALLVRRREREAGRGE